MRRYTLGLVEKEPNANKKSYPAGEGEDSPHRHALTTNRHPLNAIIRTVHHIEDERWQFASSTLRGWYEPPRRSRSAARASNASPGLVDCEVTALGSGDRPEALKSPKGLVGRGAGPELVDELVVGRLVELRPFDLGPGMPMPALDLRRGRDRREKIPSMGGWATCASDVCEAGPKTTMHLRYIASSFAACPKLASAHPCPLRPRTIERHHSRWHFANSNAPTELRSAPRRNATTPQFSSASRRVTTPHRPLSP